MTTIDGVDFTDAWPDRFNTNFVGIPVFVISRYYLIANKEAAGRLQDLADAERLKETRESA
jgi:hypothetical protein